MKTFICAGCGRIYLEGAERCGHCGAGMEERQASGRGVVYSFSSVHMGARGMPTPYLLALVELEEGGRILARLADDGEDEPSIGDAVVFSGITDAGACFSDLLKELDVEFDRQGRDSRPGRYS